MSITGLAARPGTEVDPMCSIDRARPESWPLLARRGAASPDYSQRPGVRSVAPPHRPSRPRRSWAGVGAVPSADLLQAAPLWPLDIPLMRTTIPIKTINRRSGYLSAAARALLILLTE